MNTNLFTKETIIKWLLLVLFTVWGLLSFKLPQGPFNFSTKNFEFEHTPSFVKKDSIVISNNTSLLKEIKIPIPISDYDNFKIKVNIDTVIGDSTVKLYVDLYGKDYDYPQSETIINLNPKVTNNKIFLLNLKKTPTNLNVAYLRLFYFSNTNIIIKEISINSIIDENYKYWYFSFLILCISIISFTVIKFNYDNLYKTILVHSSIYMLLITFLSVFDNSISIWNGDGFEYGMMIESFLNHFSPDMRLQDLSSFVNKYPNEYINFKNQLIQNSFFNNSNFKSNLAGYFTNLHNEKISYHFWFYSLINTPSMIFLMIFNLNPSNVFALTNFIIITGLFFYINFKCTLNIKFKAFVLLGYITSPVMYYLKWSHPEFFIYTIIYIAIILFYEKKYFLSALFIAIASLQNSVLLILFSLNIAIILYNIYKNIINNKKIDRNDFFDILKIIIIGTLAIIPFIYFYINFKTTSLIVEMGYMSNSNNLILRFLSYFFDFNQGVLVGIPMFLFVIIFLIIKNIIFRKYSIYDILIIAILLQAFSLTKVLNWNCGSSVIQRYALWAIPIIIIYVTENLIKTTKGTFFILFILISQVYLFNKNNGLKGNNDYVSHTEFSKYILNNYPYLYNPDEEIFRERTQHFEGFSNDSIIYYNNDKIKKILIYEKNNYSPQNYTYINR